MVKNKLGRGLGAILSEVEEAYNKEIESGIDRYIEIPIDKISPNPLQPRKKFNEDSLKELSESIKKHGIIQPILAIKNGDGYLLVAGERRLRASKMAGLDSIKAIVADIETPKIRELALIENIQREDLNPIDLANSYKELIDEHTITQEELSEIVGKSRSQISNTLRLLTLEEDVKEYVGDGKISQGHAKIIAGLDKDKQKAVAKTIIGQKLSVRETEKLAESMNKKKEVIDIKKNENIKLKSIFNIEKKLKELGFNIKIKNNCISIYFEDENKTQQFLTILKD